MNEKKLRSDKTLCLLFERVLENVRRVYSSKSNNYQMPLHDNRSLSYLTQAEATLDSTGGKLSAPDSDVTIAVDSGTVPEGTHHKFFFRVVYDETSLLRDIPETPDRTLISPVIECGPHDINLLKPVEITVPHCLFFDEIKKDSIAVYRCEKYSDKGKFMISYPCIFPVTNKYN